MRKGKENALKLMQDKTAEAKLSRHIKLSLNKMTPTNYEKLKDKINELSLGSVVHCRDLVTGIFDKAWSE